MVQQKVQLRKIRDFGENISDTFQFIKQEFKPFLLSFISIAGIFIITEAFLVGIMESSLLSSLRIATPNYYTSQPNVSAFTGTFFTYYFLMLAIGIISTEVMCVVIGSYLKAYLDSGRSPAVSEVWQIFSKNIFRVLVYSLVPWIIIFIGCFLCLLPGLFFMVVFAPFEIMLVVEDCSFGEAFSKCFAFLKDFWLSLGIYLVSTLITYFGTFIIYVAGGIIIAIISKFTTSAFESSIGPLIGAVSIFSYFFFIILYISICMNYFSMTEKRDATGLMEKLQTLGAENDPHTNIQEEF